MHRLCFPMSYEEIHSNSNRKSQHQRGTFCLAKGSSECDPAPCRTQGHPHGQHCPFLHWEDQVLLCSSSSPWGRKDLVSSPTQHPSVHHLIPDQAWSVYKESRVQQTPALAESAPCCVAWKGQTRSEASVLGVAGTQLHCAHCHILQTRAITFS